MKRAFEVFDRWANQPAVNGRDLGYYRIIFSSVLILILPPFTWVSKFPASLFVPPAGPMQLFHDVPPRPFMLILELLLAVSVVMLGFGLFTRAASLAVAA